MLPAATEPQGLPPIKLLARTPQGHKDICEFIKLWARAPLGHKDICGAFAVVPQQSLHVCVQIRRRGWPVSVAILLFCAPWRPVICCLLPPASRDFPRHEETSTPHIFGAHSAQPKRFC